MKLTDQALIELVAEGVMGWRRAPHDWNPLRSMGAAMMVAKKLGESGHYLTLSQGDMGGRWWAWFTPQKPVDSECEIEPGKAICLAAQRVLGAESATPPPKEERKWCT